MDNLTLNTLAHRETKFNEPTHQTTDYIEISFLITSLLIGGILNLISMVNLNEKRQNSMSRGDARLLMLKFHLNVTDMMVFFIYAASKICWLITYDWRGGPLLCPLLMFAHALTFHISSYVIVAIALDRLFTTLSGRWREKGRKYVKHLIVIAWGLAVLASLPQIGIWQLYYPAPMFSPFSQCVSIWQILRYEEGPFNKGTFYGGEFWYNIIHLTTLFYAPLIIISFCYLRIGVVIGRYHSTTLQDSCMKRYAWKALRTSVLVILGYVICWSPYIIMDTVRFIKNKYTMENMNFIYAFVVANSIFNPFLYGGISLTSCCSSERRRLREDGEGFRKQSQEFPKPPEIIVHKVTKNNGDCTADYFTRTDNT